MPSNSFSVSCLKSALDPAPQTKAILQWLETIRSKQSFTVTPIEFSQLEQWRFDEESGNLVHQSGKFFRVLGLQQTLKKGHETIIWEQPIIEQAEVGILGFITKIDNGLRRFLLQAKFEPGSMNGLQLAPTVQATHSNYSQVHQGQKPPYVEYFTDLAHAKILYDSLQSEHGCRFLRKKNRNLIIEVDSEIHLKEEFCWVTLRELHELAQLPNLLNMPARSVLAAVNYAIEKDGEKDPLISEFGKKVLQSFSDETNFLIPLNEIQSWVKNQRTQCEIKVTTVGLKNLQNWIKTPTRITPRPGSSALKNLPFSVGAVAVEAKMREVSKWSQPLMWCDRAPWTSGLVTQVHNGVLHCLVQNLFEPGLPDKSELGPTLSYRQPEASLHECNPLEFGNLFATATPSQVRYDSLQSSEGGRFYFEQNRLMILELDPTVRLKKSDRHQWMTLAQLRSLLNEYGWLNIELRELMACLNLTGNR